MLTVESIIIEVAEKIAVVILSEEFLPFIVTAF